MCVLCRKSEKADRGNQSRRRTTVAESSNKLQTRRHVEVLLTLLIPFALMLPQGALAQIPAALELQL